MSTTYQLTTFRGNNLSPLSFTHQVADGKVVQFGYPTSKTLILRKVAVVGTQFTPQFGYPTQKTLKPLSLNKNFISYHFQFYYPSNGKIPGSPIPPAGQLLPRPL